MEVALQAQRPVSCSRGVLNQRNGLKIKPFLVGSFPHVKTGQFSSVNYWSKEHGLQITAAADFSRRRQRKISTARPKGSSTKGFTPKSPVGTSTQKRELKNSGEKEGSISPKSSEIAESNKQKLETEVDKDEEQAIELTEEKKVGEEKKAEEVSPTRNNVAVANKQKLETEVDEDEERAIELPLEKKVEEEKKAEEASPTRNRVAVANKQKLETEVDEDEEQAIELPEEKNVEEEKKAEEVSPTRNKVAVANKQKLETEVDKDEEQAIELPDEMNAEEEKKAEEVSPTRNKVAVANKQKLETEVDKDEEQAIELPEEKNVEEENKAEEVSPTRNKVADANKQKLETEVDKDEEQAIELPEEKKVEEEKKAEEVSPTRNKVAVAISNQVVGNGSISRVDKDVTEREDNIVAEGIRCDELKNDGILNEEKTAADEKTTKNASLKVKLKLEMEENLHKKELERLAEESLRKKELERLAEENLRKEEIERLAAENLHKKELERLAEENLRKEELERLAEENLRKKELERLAEENLRKKELERLAEENLRKEEIERLAEENFSKGNKLFVYPQMVKPDQDIEVFLNRSLSTLSNEPDVLIMGAFNDWRWKSFTFRLKKTHLNGDWWSCLVHIPKEAYKMDFVFFNGKNVYDNNGKKDFCIPVEGGMDAFAFDGFLLEEKRQELERLAKEQAEKGRQEEEQRRREAEKAASEADRARAREETAKRRGTLQELMRKASRSVDNVWYIEPSEFKGEDMVKLYYDKSSGPLAHANDIWIHGGHNNWKDGLSIREKLVSSERKDGDWWYAKVVVPDRAFVLDWVFADGPPQSATVYDNNRRQDFHAIVPNSIPEELYWVEEEHRLYRKLQEERRLREEAIRAKAEKTARMRAETKERTLKRFLLSQKHVVYTEPLVVQAGTTVTVHYNPANTVLNGKAEIWFRCSFNRWTHRKGPLPPQKMLPAENGSHVKTTVKVPLDAYMMDFVFSEKEDGGIFDNREGMDYHIPVSGGIVKEPPMHIVHVAVEIAPIAKVGGLGDVVTSLSRAVQDLNHTVDIILPKYDCLNLSQVKDLHYQRSYSWGGTEIKVWFGKVEGLSVYFLEPQNGMFSAGCIYGCRNDGERFGFFCHAALEFLHQNGFHPDIIHCHDWTSAPVAWLFKDHYMHYGLSKTCVVFTIHNLEFGEDNIAKAMAHSHKATTVSPTYSREISGNPVIAPHLYKFHGILNGIDPDIWDPYNDKFIPVPYTSENVVEGKRAAKEALQQSIGLKKADLPLVGIITRLTHQKGIHLIKHAIWRILERGGQVVLLGSAPDPRIQNDFVNLANELHSSHNDRARLRLTYDEPLSHLIYAGSDFILVPSIFEPCGLTQLTAMRYGSIAVVRKTGGLFDTVFDVDHDKERAEGQGLEPNGFNFDGADPAGVDYALNRAISAWYDNREWFYSLCKRVMEQDWSWNKPALDYLELYHAALK